MQIKDVRELMDIEKLEERIENEKKTLRQSYSEEFQSGKPFVVICVGTNTWKFHKGLILEVATEYGYDLFDKDYNDFIPTVDLTFKKGKVEQKKWTCGYCSNINPDTIFQCCNCGAKRVNK